LFHFLHSGNDFFGRIENTVGLRPAGVAPLTLFVVLEGALLAEVMPAFGHDGVGEGVPAEDALERKVPVLVGRNLVLVVVRIVLKWKKMQI